MLVAVSSALAVTFLVGELCFGARMGRWLSVSYFLCALAYSVAVGFIVLQIYPPPVPPRPPLPFWSAVYHVVSGGVLVDVGRQVGQFIKMIYDYAFTVVGCSMASGLIVAIQWKKQHAARYVLLLNSPGLLFSAYFLVGLAYDLMS